jgi:hypothetical protein
MLQPLNGGLQWCGCDVVRAIHGVGDEAGVSVVEYFLEQLTHSNVGQHVCEDEHAVDTLAVHELPLTPTLTAQRKAKTES